MAPHIHTAHFRYETVKMWNLLQVFVFLINCTFLTHSIKHFITNSRQRALYPYMYIHVEQLHHKIYVIMAQVIFKQSHYFCTHWFITYCYTRSQECNNMVSNR